MNFNYLRILETFIIGLIICFILTMFLGDTAEIFIGLAIIYLAAIIAGNNINNLK